MLVSIIKKNQNYLPLSLKQKIGGSISNDILFGKGSIKLVNIAKLRCKKLTQNTRLKVLDKHFLEQS